MTTKCRLIGWWIAACLACLTHAAYAQPAHPRLDAPQYALQPRLTLEFAQGAIHLSERPGWIGGFQLFPGIAYAGLELNGLIAVPFANPHWDLQLGGRGSYAMFSMFAGVLKFRLAVEASYLFDAKAPRSAAGIMFDMAAVLRIGAWFGRDFERDAYYWQLTLGSDLFTWNDPIGAVVKAGPMPEYP